MSESADDQWKQLVEMDHGELPDAEVTSMIKLSIRRRYKPPEWIMAYEYPSPRGKRADAIAYNTLPSRNYKLVGFEFKASRSDWLNEKKNGEKADYFVQVCDEWYVVAGRKGIVKEDELPDGWGLMELKPNSGQIWELVESDLTDHQEGEFSADRHFFSKFMKVAVGDESNYTARDIREAKRRGYENAKDELSAEDLDRNLRSLQRDAASWQRLKTEGFDFLNHKADEREIQRLKAAYKLIKRIEGRGYRSITGPIRRMRSEVSSSAKRFDKAAEDLQDQLQEFQREHLVLEDGDD